MPDIAHLRREYGSGQLTDHGVLATWWEQFENWFADVAAAGLDQPQAVVLATADGYGRPRARTVLVKSWDENGFVWVSNYDSRKGHDLAVNPYAALCFSWIPLERQVHVEGPVSRISAAQSDAVFAARPRGAQIAAWASPQSEALPGGRAELEELRTATADRFADGPIPRPPRWGGYLIVPERVEFWQGRPDRLHDRIRFSRADTGWTRERLAP